MPVPNEGYGVGTEIVPRDKNDSMEESKVQ